MKVKTSPIDNAFEMQMKYHYYEEKIFDLDTYFGGFNWRQLKRLMFVFGNLSMSYTDYYLFLECKKRKGVIVTDHEMKVLEIYRSVANRINTLVQQLNTLPNTSPTRYSNQHSTMGQQYHKDLHGRRWVKPTAELELQKYVRYINKNGCGPTEEYHPEIKQHINGINQNLTSYIAFGGHWVGYFFTSIMENGNENGLDSIDMENFNNLIQDSKMLYNEIQAVKGLTVKCKY